MKNKFFLFSALLFLCTCNYTESCDTQNRIISLFELKTVENQTHFFKKAYSPNNSLIALGSKDHQTLISLNIVTLCNFNNRIGASVLHPIFPEIPPSDNRTSRPIKFSILQKEIKVLESIQLSNNIVFTNVEQTLQVNQLIYYI